MIFALLLALLLHTLQSFPDLLHLPGGEATTATAASVACLGLLLVLAASF